MNFKKDIAPALPALGGFIVGGLLFTYLPVQNKFAKMGIALAAIVGGILLGNNLYKKAHE